MLICLSMIASAFVSTSLNYEISHDESHLYPAPVESKKLDINNISTWFRTNGSFNRDPATGNEGFEWSKGLGTYAVYASGLWIGAKVEQDTLVCLAEFDYEYLPGYIDNNGVPQGKDDPAYRIYSIIRGDTVSPDYLNWPANQGAYLNENGKPFFLGTQTMFYSHTDGYPEAHQNNAGSTAPLKVQILQTNWAYTNLNLRDVAFTEFKIINRSNKVWSKTYLAIWTDAIIGDANDNAVGCDTNLSLTYTYNSDNNDPIYGLAPPAMGFLILRNPVSPSPGDTAKYFDPPGSNNLLVKPDHREVRLSAFNMFYNADPVNGDPSNYKETYRNLQGLRRTGLPWINPLTNQPTTFAFSGDPVSGTGWIDGNSGQRRSMTCLGPLTVIPNDTQSVIFAQVIARGSSNINSIAKLRELSVYVKSIYQNNFQNVLSSNVASTKLPDEFTLHQNYPNPFNPTTHIRYELPVAGGVNIAIYDITGKEISRPVSGYMPPGNHEIEFDASGLPGGVYFCRMEVESGTNGTILTKSIKLLFLK